MATRGQTAVSMNLRGMPELYAQLERLSKSMGRAALERAGLDAAEPTARLMRQMAPKDTGELAESIDVGTTAEAFDGSAKVYARTIREGGTKQQGVAALRDFRRGIKGQRGDLYATVFIGPVAGRSKDEVIKGYVQEFGTASVPPHSYVRAAFEQDKAALAERLSKAIRFEVFAAIEKAGRLGRLKG